MRPALRLADAHREATCQRKQVLITLDCYTTAVRTTISDLSHANIARCSQQTTQPRANLKRIGVPAF